MLKVEALSKPLITGYSDAITHLSSNSQAIYRNQPVGGRQNGEPSFDASQVCCWVCEKPLGNGMRMCSTLGGKIAMLKEPEYQKDEMESQSGRPESTWGPANYNDIDQLLLLCGDCSEGLLYSLENEEKTRRLIVNSGGHTIEDLENGNVRDIQHYILPNSDVFWDPENQKIVDSVREMALDHHKSYAPDECFVYERKVAWIKQQISGDKGLDTVEEKFKSYVFVEPNPSIPVPLQIMAQNTIRLFCLNAIYYNFGLDHHEICYNVSRGETEYDDLRLIGRDKAWRRASDAVEQLRMAREFDQGLYSVLLDQQKVLMELNGYRSVWAKVFNDGNDPDGLSNLGLPAPIGPVLPDKIISGDIENNHLKKHIIDLETSNEDIAGQLKVNIEKLAKKDGKIKNLKWRNDKLSNIIRRYRDKPESDTTDEEEAKPQLGTKRYQTVEGLVEEVLEDAVIWDKMNPQEESKQSEQIKRSVVTVKRKKVIDDD